MKKETFDKSVADRKAAYMLMEQWVKEHTGDMARSLMEIAPFLNGETSMAELQRHLNTVNMTFASVALQVIQARNENKQRCLPADAQEMDVALYDLRRFFKMFSTLADIIEQNSNHPAFRMSIGVCDDVDSI